MAKKWEDTDSTAVTSVYSYTMTSPIVNRNKDITEYGYPIK
jgi:hypothetical protein